MTNSKGVQDDGNLMNAKVVNPADKSAGKPNTAARPRMTRPHKPPKTPATIAEQILDELDSERPSLISDEDLNPEE